SVSVQPQKFFVEKIGGDKVEVSVMVPPGADPHVYEPKPQQMVELSKSKLYFATGVDFENSWLDRFASSNPDMKIVHTEENIEKIPMQHIELEISEAEDEDEHAHHDDEGGLDPHIWLSPPSVKSQLDVILENLIETDPDNAGLYRLNYDRFCEEINSLDTELKNMFSGGNIKKEFIVFHPAWGYFARAYGLRQIPVEIEGKEPKPRDLVKLIDYARENEIKVIFVQPQISPQTASMIANEIGGEVVTADPLAENWLENLRNVAQKFKNSMK
ncbi:MAG: zinc ABC transporter solute-binding protein, partial [bacterium]|nr:zinc ABC transporter solute-binding protein [bacterium]